MQVGSRGDRWFWRVAALIFVVLAVWDAIDRQWVEAFGHPSLAICYFALVNIRRVWIKRGFRRGYNQYQNETIARCAEAVDRGLSSRDFFISEIERATGVVRIPYEDGGL